MNQVITAFDEGGFFMYPILVFAIVAMAIGFERIYYVLFRANINGTAFMGQVQKLIMAHNIDRAIKLCNAEPNAALPRVLKAGLTRANRSQIEIQNAVDGKINNCWKRMQREWTTKLMDDPSFNDPIPSNQADFVNLVTARPDYKNRKARDDA